jgi:hypothetical protein
MDKSRIMALVGVALFLCAVPMLAACGDGGLCEHEDCSRRWTNCDDGATYVVECETYGPGTSPKCFCYRNGEQQGSFLTTSASSCLDVATVNRECRWGL